MSKIDWESRVKSKAFWVAIIPAVLLLVQAVASLFGYQWDFVALNEQLTAVVNSAFGVLVLLGVVVDPSTPGIGDEDLADLYGQK